MPESSFPTLRITREDLVPQGAFAVAQAQYLRPDRRTVDDLAKLCRDRSIGVVAHFYMDAELQGVLTACDWPHIQIADSLKMADAAVKMAEAGMKTIVVLGVDFMSENVRAVLDAAGHEAVEVYRVAEAEIGCSLAESAEKPAYTQWLEEAGRTPRALHVVYINTSLQTKAKAHSLVPTITCTSSNVVQTILQADAQIDGVEVFYGPDTYMGHNLQTMFAQFTQLSDDAIRAIHPAHDRASIAALLDRFHPFEHGACVVHHMFGGDVVRRVKEEHAGAFHTAHLEVPGEMFELAVKAQSEGRGVVGSTSNILGFIADKVAASLGTPERERLSFVLGTEAGMVTAIVKKVQDQLRAAHDDTVEVEIVFPVASEAIAQAPESGLEIIPGVASGEGCSVAGGCATCPYMKMNHLDALFDVLETVGTDAERGLSGFRPKKYTATIAGRTAADLGSEPILHMRHFQKHGVLPDALVQDVLTR
ncbi:MAG: quinolinate synthase NadA [Alphaproteobacteria bacterium]|nr:quinolinate synthase NadA [Alphaproteobacteria bacterium]